MAQIYSGARIQVKGSAGADDRVRPGLPKWARFGYLFAEGQVMSMKSTAGCIAALAVVLLLSSCASFPRPQSDRDTLLLIPASIVKKDSFPVFGHYQVHVVGDQVDTVVDIPPYGGYGLVQGLPPGRSPRIEKIEVIRHARVRRKQLYYLRGLTGKAARLKELRPMTSKELAAKEAAKAAKLSSTTNTISTANESTDE